MRWQMQYKAPFCTIRVREEMDFVSMLFTEADATLTNVLTQVQTEFSRWRDRPTVPTALSQADENSPAGRPAEEARVSIVPRQYRGLSIDHGPQWPAHRFTDVKDNIRCKWSWIIFALRTRMIFKSNTWSFSLSIQGWNSGGGKNKYSSRDERSTVSMPRLVPRGGRLIHVTKWLFP